MATRYSKDELIDLALEEIAPIDGTKDACHEDIVGALAAIERVSNSFDGLSSPGEFKKRINQFIKSLKKTRQLLAQFHPAQQNLIFRGVPVVIGPVDPTRLFGDLDRMIATCEFTAKHLRSGHGAKPWNSVKFICTLCASNLLSKFSPTRLSTTKGGHFTTLASLLYEIVSGEEGRDLSAYCENPDRVEPLYVAKIGGARRR
jgi:hypothetical protein